MATEAVELSAAAVGGGGGGRRGIGRGGERPRGGRRGEAAAAAAGGGAGGRGGKAFMFRSSSCRPHLPPKAHEGQPLLEEGGGGGMSAPLVSVVQDVGDLHPQPNLPHLCREPRRLVHLQYPSTGKPEGISRDCHSLRGQQVPLLKANLCQTVS